MVSIASLWLPIVVSAVVVFLASWVMHMLLTYHQSDYAKLDNESEVMDALRELGVKPGTYAMPRPASVKDMGTPEVLEKYKKGPVAWMTVMPSGPPAMGRSLALWFVFCLVIGVFAAYLAGRLLEPGTHYLSVFRVVGTTAFLGYGVGWALDSIWKARAWSATLKHIFDGLVYALLTAGTFGWLWPA